jgi:N-acetyl-anhydromuramyl-L-alanine amidase AmpD
VTRLGSLVGTFIVTPFLIGAGGDRRLETSYIVIHAVSGPIVEDSASWTPRCHPGPTTFTGKTGRTAREWADELARELKAHYVVGERGEIEPALDRLRIANHAGYSRIANAARNPNEFSVAIELVNDGDGNDPYEDAQVDALVCLVTELRREFGVPLDHIVRHSDIDARSVSCPELTPPIVKVKQDPGARFPWNDFVVRVANADCRSPR